MTDEVNSLADFNDLVLTCGHAQQEFDDWDEGATFDPVSGKRRVVGLDTLSQQWSEANLALLYYVREHGEEIEAMIMKEGNP